MYLYVFLSALYRLSCGALILAINWLMLVENNTPFYLAVLVALTFVPAILVPLFYKNKKQLSGLKLTSYALLASFFVSFLLFFAHNHIVILCLNTTLWFFFFIMESSWEMWFVALAKKYSQQKILQFSSFSMSVNQISLMLGPVVAAFIFKHNPKEVILMSSLIFLFLFFSTFFLSHKEEIANEELKEELKRDTKIQLTGLECALIFIWPTLALFNFMLPVQVAYHKGDMIEVGILDAAMGLGMIFSSILLAKKMFYQLFIQYKMSVVFLIVAIVFWSFLENFIFKIVSVFILGLCFNISRIFIRSVLAQKYEAYIVGTLVSKANSYSFFLIVISLLIFYDKVSINYIIPFAFAILISLLLPLKTKNG
ncbi:hypothetical protein OQH60_02705 [Campylobacter sp. MIT 21-1685]|uniref:hypothetical protein n=1 Tax=unclassified Campylobacter TaxID=2593542 RepID=UPI00224AAE2A|nr:MULTISPECIES: hypothetical protein [unclassified Campylobacter]MCX2682780.1 hypothetical protein [Campylobacter sp. MIT 21-1684]MCX2751074.1 hypothetical protein [Campylobacter sp. MIT 21-1682]MCX2807261.1 hypothetical protein [Campylobacter sp. MIT 21-1685]